MKKRATQYEAELASCGSADAGFDIEDNIHRHFSELAASFDDWLDVANEGRRLWNVMFNEKFDDWSPEDSLISGVAAAAYSLAISEVATRLGVSAFALECAIESQEEPGVVGFLAECQAWNKTEENHQS